jgi:hypothetical protein
VVEIAHAEGRGAYEVSLMPWNGYPTTLYRALKLSNGKVVCVQADVIHRTSLVVRNEDAYLKAVGQGWCDHPDLALEQFERFEQEIGQASAERAYKDLRMSEPAQRESEAYEKTVSGHVPVIPEAKP